MPADPPQELVDLLAEQKTSSLEIPECTLEMGENYFFTLLIHSLGNAELEITLTLEVMIGEATNLITIEGGDTYHDPSKSLTLSPKVL